MANLLHCTLLDYCFWRNVFFLHATFFSKLRNKVVVVAIILGALNTIIHFKSPFIAVFCNIGQSALKGEQEGWISLWYFLNILPSAVLPTTILFCLWLNPMSILDMYSLPC